MYSQQPSMFATVAAAAALQMGIRRGRAQRLREGAAEAGAAEGVAAEGPVPAAAAAGHHARQVQEEAEGADHLHVGQEEGDDSDPDGSPGDEHEQVVVPRRRRRPMRHRVYRDCISFEDLTEAACRRRLRLSRETVGHICQLMAQMKPRGTGRHAIPVRVKVTVALNFFVTGSFQSPSGDLCGISQASVHRCIWAVTDSLCAVAARYINFPEDHAHQAARASQFASVAGIPMVQGVVDGVHVNLRAPTRDRDIFLNRKGTYSMNVQVVCDQGMRIMHVSAQYPGSVHDAFILAQSYTPAIFKGHPPRMRGWLLGDRGYPLRPWLMTPIRRPQTNTESRYNEAHDATRGVVERSFGLLKMRFRCLERSGGTVQYDPDRVGRIVVACCGLHNIAQHRGDVMEEEESATEAVPFPLHALPTCWNCIRQGNNDFTEPT
ncbi:LOW QUALITY PROTEIN: putative nuclease HARBI1 [Scyliorhinus torazame]|uniref:LOW QUALITY PROTEIN: putative nuclease HARBI1 n=1 Tax=Scyliorhinus torazame TaxID=75743 RepID=UPI003B5BC6C1